ncbi:MAG: TlpA disulfide reductase family protein [Pseudomonadota bacterium]
MYTAVAHPGHTLRRFTSLALGGAALAFAMGSIAAPAPAFTLPTTAGASISLGEHKGKIVYVDFWASWCGPCRQSFPWMNEMLGKYQTQGFEIIAVNLDAARADADHFLEANPASFTVALDPLATMPPQYGVKGMPTSYLIDGEGEIILQHTGFNDSHTADLEAAIQKALETK